MNIAFYAPMKPPNSPVPSGDRNMARALVHALEHAGHRVELASEFQSRDGVGDPARQRELAATGARIADELIAEYEARPAEDRPGLWFTYHLYYKAPDWLGPPVCEALAIPYAVAEASHAPKRAGGPWNLGHEAAARAIARADVIFGLNSANAPCVLPLLADRKRLVALPPFLDTPPAGPPRDAARAEIAAAHGLDPKRPWLLAVAMMREGAKLESYRVLAEALHKLADQDWQLIVVGEGPARQRIESRFDTKRTRFVGEVAREALAPFYAAADLYVWPAIDEAYGMAILEAQAAGLPVIAGRTLGVGDIVRDGETGILVRPGSAGAFARAVAGLLHDGALRAKMGAKAAEIAARDHGLAAAAAVLDGSLRALSS